MVHFNMSSHLSLGEPEQSQSEGWEAMLRVLASLASVASGWAVHTLGVVGYRWSVTAHPIAGQWSPSATLAAYTALQAEAKTHPALRYGAFGAAGLWAGGVKAITHMLLQENIFAPLLATTEEEEEEGLDGAFQPYDPVAPVKHGDMYQRGKWKGPIFAMASAAGAVLLSLPFLKAKFLLRTQARLPDGTFKYNGLFQTLSVMWREQRFGLITNNLGAFVSFGILYDLAGFLIDRFKLSTFIMKLRTPEGPLQNAKHAIALAADDVVESLIVVALTMPLSSIIRRLTVQAGGVAPFSSEGIVYTGVLDCLLQIIRREGISGLYKGAMPEFLERLMPRMLVDAIVDFTLNSFFGVPSPLDEDEVN